MKHRAALYSVRVHPLHKPKESRRFGDFDGNGAFLATVLDQYLSSGFSVGGADKIAQCVSSNVVGDDLEMKIKHGLSGMTSDIVDRSGNQRIHREVDDVEEISCGALFRLPRSETTGWWAVHVQGNRSAKQLVYEGLSERFRADYDALKLLVSPAVSGAALEAAVDQGQINTVKLTRLDKPTDIRQRITDKWVRSDQNARVEIGIRAGKGEHVLSDLINRYLKGENELFGQIVEFNGAEFDTAKVEVALEDGTTRTFNIENPEAGHALTVDMDDLDFVNGEPTETSVLAGLRQAIDEMTS
jgi:hypothetical protein